MKQIFYPLCAAVFLTAFVKNGRCQTNSITYKKEPQMENLTTARISTVQHNKEIIKKVFEEGLNARRMDVLELLISDDYPGPGGSKGAAAFQEPIAPLMKAFPDVQWQLVQMIGEGNKVVVTWKVVGTHSGPLQGISPTGKSVSNNGMAVFELKGNKIVKSHTITDRLGFLQELGVLPIDMAQLKNYRPDKEQIGFIDKFYMLASAEEEFMRQLKYNRDFIKGLPGFVRDEAYRRVDESGNIVFETITIWKNQDYVIKAKELVAAEYKRIDFSLPEFLQRMNIKLDRAIYQPIVD